jgi:hypothetical protein
MAELLTSSLPASAGIHLTHIKKHIVAVGPTGQYHPQFVDSRNYEALLRMNLALADAHMAISAYI